MLSTTISEGCRFLSCYPLPQYLPSSLPNQNNQRSSVSRDQPVQPQAVFTRFRSLPITGNLPISHGRRKVARSPNHTIHCLNSIVLPSRYHSVDEFWRVSQAASISHLLVIKPHSREVTALSSRASPGSNSGALQLTINHSQAQAAGQ